MKKLRSGNESQKGGVSLRDSGDSCVTSYHWPTEKKRIQNKKIQTEKNTRYMSLSIYISGHTASIHMGAGEGKNDGKCKINRRITRDDVWWEMEKRKKKESKSPFNICTQSRLLSIAARVALSPLSSKCVNIPRFPVCDTNLAPVDSPANRSGSFDRI